MKVKVLEFAQNITGMTKTQIAYSRMGWGNKSCHHCHGILDYLYGTWWTCRDCGRWSQL